MMMIKKKSKKDTYTSFFVRSQSGNMFFYILLGIALFSALAFTVSRGMRGQSSTALSKRQVDLVVSEILSNAQDIENAVSRMRRNSISEGELCFSHDEFSIQNNNAYTSIETCLDNAYRLYHPEGGGLSFRKIPEDWLDFKYESDQGYGEWMFTNVNGVSGIGESDMNEPSSMELVAFIPHLKKDLCEAINMVLGLDEVLPNNFTAFIPDPVDDGFTSASGKINAVALDGQYTGCFKNNSVWENYIFYRVLIEH